MTTDQRKKAFLVAFKKHLGHVSNACKAAKIDRGSYYNWIREDKAFAQAAKDIEESLLDLAENKLLRNIKRGYEKSIFFYLERKGKRRGYQKEENVNLKTVIRVTLEEDTPEEEPDAGS